MRLKRGKKAIRLITTFPENVQKLSVREARTLVRLTAKLGGVIHSALWQRAYPEVI